MSMRYFYVKSGDYGMDQFGRWTDNPVAWKIYTDRSSVCIAASKYPGATVGIL